MGFKFSKAKPPNFALWVTARIFRKILHLLQSATTALDARMENIYQGYIRRFDDVLVYGQQNALSGVVSKYLRNAGQRISNFAADAGKISASMDVLNRYYLHLRQVTRLMAKQPKISVLVPLYKVEPRFLREALASIAAQSYENWEACIVDDASGGAENSAIVDEFARKFPGKVKVAVNPKNMGICLTSNRALELATGEYFSLLDHDDRLYPNALGEVVRHLNLFNEPDVLYSDEVTVDEDGHFIDEIYHKPAWSPMMHLCVNYTTHLSTYRTALVRELGGFRVGYEGSQDHDLMLRVTEATEKPVVHIPMCLYQWRAHIQSTASSIEAKPYAIDAGIRAVTDACVRRGRPAEVTFEQRTLHYRVKFQLPASSPLVSIIIPTKDRLHLIRTCVESILEKTSYPHYEIIVVDNGTTDLDCLAYLDSLKTAKIPITVLRDESPFNFARLNNLGVARARGSYVLLLNNDTEIVTPEWIEELLRVAQFPEVGAVGAKLLYPNGKIQHAGVMLSGRNIATHSLCHNDEESLVYSSYAQTLHETACITGACLMIEKKKYLQVDGLDEVFIPNGFGDVDFGIKLLAAGWANVYTPYAVLIHHESPSRGLNSEVFEQLVILKRWPAQLMVDPYRNFCLQDSAHFKPDPIRMIPELAPHDFQTMIAAAFPADKGRL